MGKRKTDFPQRAKPSRKLSDDKAFMAAMIAPIPRAPYLASKKQRELFRMFTPCSLDNLLMCLRTSIPGPYTRRDARHYLTIGIAKAELQRRANGGKTEWQS